MPRGSAPGERRGGRAKGVLNRKTIERQEVERLAAEQARDEMRKAQSQQKKLGKDILEDYMFAFHGLAARYQNNIATALQSGRDPNGDDVAAFKEWGTLTVETARHLARFQSPSFKAIAVVAPPPGTVITPSGDLPPGTSVEQVRDPQLIARMYTEIVRRVG